MKIVDIFEKVTVAQLDAIESKLDSIFQKHDIDIEFSNHFLDRINDPRNGKPITLEELEKIYSEVEKRFGRKLKLAPIRYQALMQDLSTALNIPISIDVDNNSGNKQIIAKSIMRKQNFHPKPGDDVLQVGLNSKKQHK